MNVSRYFSSRFFSRVLPVVLVVLALVVAGLAVKLAPAKAATPDSGNSADSSSLRISTCQNITVPNVALAAGQPAQYSVFGQLCNPFYGPSRTVQLLIHGSTYTHLYWNWTAESPSVYSAVRAFNTAGYSTFDIDCIGVGASSHPASNVVTLDVQSYVVHELVQLLRSGGIGGATFSHVMLIGHSYGSVIASAEAGTYHDVDAVVMTSWLHQINPGYLGILQPVPANQDPSGRFTNLDPGYLTTYSASQGDDSVRAAAFYYVPNSDPAVIASDEQTKDTLTVGEVGTISDSFTGKYTSQITVPVLEIVGNKDALFCNGAVDCSSSTSVLNEESPFFSAQAQLQVRVIANTGHDLNLHYTAPLTYTQIVAWSYQHVLPY